MLPATLFRAIQNFWTLFGSSGSGIAIYAIPYTISASDGAVLSTKATGTPQEWALFDHVFISYFSLHSTLPSRSLIPLRHFSADARELKPNTGD